MGRDDMKDGKKVIREMDKLKKKCFKKMIEKIKIGYLDWSGKEKDKIEMWIEVEIDVKIDKESFDEVIDKKLEIMGN